MLPSIPEVAEPTRCDECKWWKIPKRNDEGLCTNKEIDVNPETYPCKFWEAED